MTTNNHTPIVTGAPANAATFNSPMGELDAAIGKLSTLTTAEKGSLVAAINEAISLINQVKELIANTKNNEIIGFVSLLTPYEIDPGVSYLQINSLTNNGTIRLPSIQSVGYGSEITIRGGEFFSGPVIIDIEAADGTDDRIETATVPENGIIRFRASEDEDNKPKWYLV